MSKIGTFGSFTQARLAIYAAQLGLSVTGNNISNVNTPGYTRQRLEQISFKTGGADRYQSSFDVRVGNGVLTTGISQLRDPYLDIRYRNENSSVGAMDGKLGGLEKIAAILDEVGKGGEVKEGEEFGVIAYQLGNLFQTLSGLTDQTGQQEYDVQVRSSADSLCQELRSYAAQLEELYEDTIKSYNQNVTTVNKLLYNIRDLNSAIRQSDIHGDNALEMRDERNNLIDELSTYMKIDVTYTTEDIGAGKTVEKLVISLGNANPDRSVHSDESVLVDGRYAVQLLTQKPVLNNRSETLANNMLYESAWGPDEYTNDPNRAKLYPKQNPDFDPTKDPSDKNPPYLKEEKQPDGTTKEVPTANEQEAIKIPMIHGGYDPDSTDFKYIAENETVKYTNDPLLAAKTPLKNPHYDSSKPQEGTNLPYLDLDGKPVKDEKDAAPTPYLNTDEATKDRYPYLMLLGNGHSMPVDDLRAATPCPVENPDYMPYQTKEGNPTDKFEEAAKLDLPNFGLRLTELKDENDYIMENVVKMEERVTTEAEFGNGESKSEVLPDGSTKITTYRFTQQRILKKNNDGPNAYDPTADFATDFPDATEGPDPTNPAHRKYFKYLKTTTPATDTTPAVVVGTNNYKEADREVQTTYYAQDYIKTPSEQVALDDNDLYGMLQSQRELLTESGEFTDIHIIDTVDENAATKRGIPYFQKMLDSLANQLATSFNQNNQGYLMDTDGNYITTSVDADGKTIGGPVTVPYSYTYLTDPNDPSTSVEVKGTYTLNANVTWDKIPNDFKIAYSLQNIEDYHEKVKELLSEQKTDGKGNPVFNEDGSPATVGEFVGGNLFSVNGDSDDETMPDGTPITASNISISSSWAKGPLIVNSFVCPKGDGQPASTDSSNVLRLQGLGNQKMEYFPQTVVQDGTTQSEAMFTGTFEDMWNNIGTILGHDQKVTSTLLDNYYEKSVELDSNRASVSSVDFNDEAMNLMQYAKSYNAACRLMTTLDSVLDKLINGTGLTT